jgi:hypothetical protein
MSTLAARGLATVALAPACPACGRVLESPTSGVVCPKCWRDVRPLTPPVCDACGDPLASWLVAEVSSATCRRCTPRLRTVARARAASNYEGRLRDIIQAFKYDGRTSLARPLAALMRASGGDILDGAACAISVPLHPWRRLTRGHSVRRTRTPSRHSSRPRLVAGASHDTASRTDRSRAPHQRPRPFLAVAMAATAGRSSALARRPHHPAGG